MNAQEEEVLEHIREAEEGEELQPSQSVSVGIGPGGIIVQVTDSEGQKSLAQIPPDEAYTLAGHLIGLSSVLMNMQFMAQAQAQQQASQDMERINREMIDKAQGRRSRGGVHLPR